MVGREEPVRTCVGCRVRAPKSDLLRIVVVEDDGVASCVPDPRARMPGRGAWVHLRSPCLDLAVRRRALVRALPVPGPLDYGALRRYVAAYEASEVPPVSSDVKRPEAG